ncbi:type II secretion system F family protein [Tessaracoccus sp. OH4464_COT-324]|uniref:type II secretion system F family protein n=1 Tax=Tessaracoccus sp. OH4464_COT-324 TaxID=2491059 RepID=UPI00131A148B|nr:type II secretion system F family protein [Tessaracoccus sp. OH4464_COT-324]
MLAAVLGALAVWFALPISSAAKLARVTARPARRAGRRRLPVPLAGAVAAAGGSYLITGNAGLGWALAIGTVVGSGAWLARDRARRGRVRAREGEVAAAAQLLAQLLRSGAIPATALREAANEHPILAESAAVGALGGDVTAALATKSTEAGAEGMAALAAAWQVAERSGAPIAGVLKSVAEGLRDQRRVAQSVETELSAARASGHIMALLPFGAVAVGSFAGANPMEFLLLDQLGQWLVAFALGCTSLGVLWIERLAR